MMVVIGGVVGGLLFGLLFILLTLSACAFIIIFRKMLIGEYYCEFTCIYSRFTGRRKGMDRQLHEQ